MLEVLGNLVGHLWLAGLLVVCIIFAVSRHTKTRDDLRPLEHEITSEGFKRRTNK